LPGTWDGFELAVRAILLETEGDPVNKTLARLVAAYGQRLAAPPPGGPEWLFPSPSALRRLDSATSSCDVSPDAAERIRQLSDAVLTGAIHFDPKSTFAQLAEQLVTFARLSDCRAAWVAARTLSEPDAPLVDTNPVAGSMTSEQTSLSWRPWRTYVALIQQAVDMTTSARAASA